MELRTNMLLWVVLACVATACGPSAAGDQYFPLPDQSGNPVVVHTEALSFVADTVVQGLTRPYSMAFLPDNRVLITERSGRLLMVEEGKVKQDPLGGDIPEGLRDVVLHPDFSENRWVYLSYYVNPGEDEGGRTVLMRGRLMGNRLEETEDLYSAGPFEEGGFWYGSRIAFDREGHLFFTVGQRGERKYAQDLSHVSGKIMRLTDEGKIPEDNPFVGKSGALGEIFSYGHRQVEGLKRHPVTGDIWASEHGPMGGDEVNIIRSGFNYGWPLVTHGLNYDSTRVSPDTLREGMESPVHHWTPSIAPSGFDFVAGRRYPEWEGDLFIGSMKFRYLNRSVFEGGKVVQDEKMLQDIGRIRSIRLAPDGFLYLLTEDTGLLVRLVPVAS